MSAALMNHRLKDISPAQAVEPAAGKVGTTRRSFLRFRFFGYFALGDDGLKNLGYFALGDDALNIRDYFYFRRLREYRALTDFDVFLIRHYSFLVQ